MDTGFFWSKFSTVGAGMITDAIDDENQLPVNAEQRAARYGQKAIAIAVTGATSKEIAYKLERKLSDNGHATTVLVFSLA